MPWIAEHRNSDVLDFDLLGLFNKFDALEHSSVSFCEAIGFNNWFDFLLTTFKNLIPKNPRRILPFARCIIQNKHFVLPNVLVCYC